MRKVTKEQFIERAKQVHGDKYDYSQTEYVSYTQHVTIICPKHGPFRQRPYKHLSGQNCSACSYEERGKMHRKSLEQFIADAKAVHGDEYDYSKVNYTSAFDKVEIICPVHGSFFQSPNNHINGHGCAKCFKPGPKKKVEPDESTNV